MRISELIVELTKVLSEHGDIETAYYDSEYGLDEIIGVQYKDGTDREGWERVEMLR